VALQPAYKETRKRNAAPMVPQLDFIQEELTALLGFTISRCRTPRRTTSWAATRLPRANGHRGRSRNERQGSLPVGGAVREGLHHREGRSAFAERCVRPPGEPEGDDEMGCAAEIDRRRLALSGDSVDNIPSAGIGRKTAANLLVEHGDLDRFGKPGAHQKRADPEKLIRGPEQIQQNRKMWSWIATRRCRYPSTICGSNPISGVDRRLEKCEFNNCFKRCGRGGQGGTVKQTELLSDGRRDSVEPND